MPLNVIVNEIANLLYVSKLMSAQTFVLYGFGEARRTGIIPAISFSTHALLRIPIVGENLIYSLAAMLYATV